MNYLKSARHLALAACGAALVSCGGGGGGGGGGTTPALYHVGVTVSGLPSGQSVVLQDNGADNLSVLANSTLTNFSTTLAGGASYVVTVLTQPTGGHCTVGTGASGTIGAADVQISVSCYVTTPSVTTNKGVVVGTGTASMKTFLGIPYAKPPVGNLRWQPPQAAATWTTPLNATSFASPCAQNASYFGTASTSEDCLYLNVYVPTGTGPFPVMVFIHGGSFTSGEGSDYDPTALVASGVAVVTFNYRLGVLGFLAHPALDALSSPAANYGLMDQQFALGWVKANIAAFGGDAANVTLFGESSGGVEVLSHMASPTAAGLFHKAIVESGSYARIFPTLSAAETLGTNFGAAAGCASPQSASCLLGLPVATILANEGQIMPGGTLLPTVDGTLLTIDIATALNSSFANPVPMIVGTNQHEFSLISATTLFGGAGGEIAASDYPTYIQNAFPSTYTKVLGAYPVGNHPTAMWPYDDVFTDSVFACNGRTIAQMLSASVTLYAYEFADANAPVVYNIPARVEGYGAYHASELQYIFPSSHYHVYFPSGVTGLNTAQSALSAQMVAFWAQFAKTSNPNATGSNLWPAYTAGNDTYLSLAPGAVAASTTFAASHNCIPNGAALW